MKVLRIRVYTSGLEKIPKNQKLMFVGNHRSNFDPIIEWLVLKPWDIAFISKGENFKIPFFGRIIQKCCFMPIDRENPRKALRTINKASDLLQSGEVSIGVYIRRAPEAKPENCSRFTTVFSTLPKRPAHRLSLCPSGERNRSIRMSYAGIPMYIWTSCR